MVTGLKHQKEKRSMDHFAGLDVSVKETSVCIVDETGKIVREMKLASEPDALVAVLKAQINKTDRNDARGMAQMMRVGLYRPVHVKTLRSQKLRMLLTHRQLLLSKAIALENDLRGTLRNFGLKVGMIGKVKFEARIRRPPRLGGSGRTDAHCPAGVTGTDRHPASPSVGHCPG